MSLAGRHIGHYHLLRLLDADDLYLAQDINLGRQAVIRVKQYVEEADTARLFLARIRAIVALDHPTIVPIYELGEQTDNERTFLYLVMPYYQEGSLADWLCQHPGPLLPPEAASLIANLADALQYAHEQDVVHQHVTPATLLLGGKKAQSQCPTLFLSGFELTPLSIPGDPLYIAPEQWCGQPGPATDQYALAVIAYQLLTGDPPFMGTLEQLKDLHLHREPPPPTKRNAHLPPIFEGLFRRALAKEPEQRFPSVAAFASALKVSSQVKSNGDFYTTLTLTPATAQQGVERVIALPGGKHVPVHVPAGTSNEQVLRLRRHGELSADGRTRGDLLVSLNIRADAPREDIETTFDPALDEPTAQKISPPSPAVGSDSQAAANQSSAKPADDDITLRTIPPGPSPDPFVSTPTAPLPEAITPVLLERDQLLAPPPPAPPVPTPASSFGRFLQGPAISRMRSSTTLRNVLLLVLAFLVIAASSSLFYILRVNQLVANGVQATATASIRSLSTTYAATAAAQASATATAALDPYPPGNGTLVFDDPLSTDRNTVWDRLADSCTFTNGSYQVTKSQQGFNYCSANRPVFTNFAYQVQVTITQGDTAGIVFRLNTPKNTYYYFGVDTKNNYGLYYYDGSNYIPTLSGNSQTIHPGLNTFNLLAVVARGRNIDLYANQQHLAGISDGVYQEGRIGVAAEDDGNATTVACNNARVWQI